VDLAWRNAVEWLLPACSTDRLCNSLHSVTSCQLLVLRWILQNTFLTIGIVLYCTDQNCTWRRIEEINKYHDQPHCYHHVPTVNQRLLLQLNSWWWAWGCPKHVGVYLNDKQYTWEIAASGLLIHLHYWNSSAILYKYARQIIPRWNPVGLFQWHLQSKKAYCDRASLQTPRHLCIAVARSIRLVGGSTL
jgi:hypothetical protein